MLHLRMFAAFFLVSVIKTSRGRDNCSAGDGEQEMCEEVKIESRMNYCLPYCRSVFGSECRPTTTKTEYHHHPCWFANAK